jgi:hypothetical protein
MVFRESFTEDQNKVQKPQNDVNGGMSQKVRIYNADTISNLINFFKTNHFQVALQADIRNVVAQQDQTSLTLDNTYDMTTTQERQSTC